MIAQTDSSIVGLGSSAIRAAMISESEVELNSTPCARSSA